METQERTEIAEIEEFIKNHELTRIHFDFFERILTLVVAAISLIAALAWDEALKHFFSLFFVTKGTLTEELLYALTLTFAVTIISLILGKHFFKRRRK